MTTPIFPAAPRNVPLTPAAAHLLLTQAAVKLSAQLKYAAANQLARIADDVARLDYLDRDTDYLDHETADCVYILAGMAHLGGTTTLPNHAMQDPRDTAAFARLIETGEVKFIPTHQANVYVLTALAPK